MTKDLYNLKHALHNESVCTHLLTGVKCDDWIIITAFYSALKFASHKIFPFKAPSIAGKTTTIDSIDHYMKYDNHKNKSKHQLLVELVGKYCPEIIDSYERLLDMSMSARYKSFHHDAAFTALARSLLSKIKKSCATAEDKSDERVINFIEEKPFDQNKTPLMPEIPENENVKVPLSEKKFAFLSYPPSIKKRDIEILRKQLDLLELLAE